MEQIVVTKPSLAEHEEEKKEPEQEQEKVQEERQNLIPELETVAPNNTNQSNVIPVLTPGDLGVAEASQGENQTDRKTDSPSRQTEREAAFIK